MKIFSELKEYGKNWKYHVVPMIFEIVIVAMITFFIYLLLS